MKNEESLKDEMAAIGKLEVALDVAMDLKVPAALLAPYNAALLTAKSRAGPARLLQASVRGRASRRG